MEVCEGLGVSERRVCLSWASTGATQRHPAMPRPDEPALMAAIVDRATRYGYRRIAALLRNKEWRVDGYSEALNGKLRDELLDREIFYTLHEAQILIDGWRQHHNTVPPLSALGYRPPAVEWPPLARSPRLALGQVSLPKPQLIFGADSRGRSSLLGINLGVDQSVGAGHMHEAALPLGDHENP